MSQKIKMPGSRKTSKKFKRVAEYLNPSSKPMHLKTYASDGTGHRFKQFVKNAM